MSRDREIPCAICGSHDYRLVFRARDLNYRTTDRDFPLVRCRECGLVFINPQPEDMAPYYPDTYAQHKPNPYVRFKPSLQRKLSLFYGYPGPEGNQGKAWKHLPRYIELALKKDYFFFKFPYRRELRLLDVGCGNGIYLMQLKKLGWDPATQLFGLEFPNEALHHLRDEGINITEGDLYKNNLPENFFDIITLRHVIEHFPDPSSAMEKIHRSLKPGGEVLILAPNFRSMEALFLFREKWHNIDAPRHLFHYTPATMRRLLGKTGFQVEKMHLKKSVAPVVKSFEHYGYHVPRFVAKSVIPYILSLFKLIGFSEDLLCRAVKK